MMSFVGYMAVCGEEGKGGASIKAISIVLFLYPFVPASLSGVAARSPDCRGCPGTIASAQRQSLPRLTVTVAALSMLLPLKPFASIHPPSPCSYHKADRSMLPSV